MNQIRTKRSRVSARTIASIKLELKTKTNYSGLDLSKLVSIDTNLGGTNLQGNIKQYSIDKKKGQS